MYLKTYRAHYPDRMLTLGHGRSSVGLLPFVGVTYSRVAVFVVEQDPKDKKRKYIGYKLPNSAKKVSAYSLMYMDSDKPS
ncbi:hypothetical protein MAR_028957, partial [Mya arenaria]